MSLTNAPSPSSHSDPHDHHPEGEFGVEPNPTGPWANLNDKKLQDAILRLAGEHKHAFVGVGDFTAFIRFADFLDAFASAWIAQKAQVEKEAEKYGFSACNTTQEIPEEDRRKAALLALTLNGSFVLLGNGCLTKNGGSGHYEKIHFRTNGQPTKTHAPSGISVKGEAAMNIPLNLSSSRFDFFGHTSPLQALYFTKENLGADNALKFADSVSLSMSQYGQTIMEHVGETVAEPRAPEPAKRGDKRKYIPETYPELEPV